MKYGIESYVLNSPYSLISSIILFIGFYKIGKLIFRYPALNKIISSISIINYQYFSFAILFTVTIFYPLILYPGVNKYFFIIFSFIISGFGVYHFIEKLINFIKKDFYLKKQNFVSKYFLILFFLGYFFLAMGPITDIDSLDYHLSVPIHIINTGSFPKDILWFHASQSGLGEIPIIFGLILGAEQFGSLCQFSGILSVVGILLKKKDLLKSNNFLDKNILLTILFLSIPVLIFLDSTSKPQLIFIGFTTIAFTLTFYNDEKEHNKKNIFLQFLLISLLLYVSFEGKFSFILSSFIIWICAAYQIIKKQNYLVLICVILIILTLFLPSAFWKYTYYDGNFINKIYFPFFSYIDGYYNFYQSLNACEVPCTKNFFLFPDSLARYTESIGVAIFSIPFLFFLKEKKSKLILILIIFYFSILFLLGKFSARFFIEPILWSIICIAHSKINFNFKYFSFVKLLIYTQSFLSFSAIWLGVFTISVGSLSQSLKLKVLNRFADGYTLAKWVNSEITDEKNILYTHRSISLIQSETISADFLHYSTSEIYLNMLKSKKPDYLVVQNNSRNYHKKLINCTTGIFKKKENAFIATGRNIFNKNKQLYSGYIYNFNHKKLPSCYSKN